jgi:hypothetical protein
LRLPAAVASGAATSTVISRDAPSRSMISHRRKTDLVPQLGGASDLHIVGFDDDLPFANPRLSAGEARPLPAGLSAF